MPHISSRPVVNYNANTFNDSISQPQDKSMKGFLDLPRELRDKFYHKVLTYWYASGTEPVRLLQQMALVSKQLDREFLQSLLSDVIVGAQLLYRRRQLVPYHGGLSASTIPSRWNYAMQNCALEVKKIMDTSNDKRGKIWLQQVTLRLADALRGCASLKSLMICLTGRMSKAELSKSDDDARAILDILTSAVPNLTTIAVNISRSYGGYTS